MPEILSRLASMHHSGLASEALLEAWHQHTSENANDKGHDAGDGVYNRVDLSLDAHQWDIVRDPLEQFFRNNPIRVVGSLGSHLSAAFFTGPRINTIVLSADVAQNPVAMTFQVMEIFLHYLNAHLKSGTYDFLPEFRRDARVPSRYVTDRYAEYEGSARRAACCLWDNAYSESMLDPALVHTALRQRGVNKDVLRGALQDKELFRDRLYGQVRMAVAAMLGHRVHVPALYQGPIAVVKAPDDVDINVYLLQIVRRPGSAKATVCRRNYLGGLESSTIEAC